MNSEFFIAKRIYFNKEGEKQVSPPAIRIAIVSMALGLVIMILSLAIVVGFKKEVREKIIGFGSHIQITNFKNNSLYENYPISIDNIFLKDLYSYSNIQHVQGFINKPAVIKTDEDFMGILVKGIDENFDWHFFQQNLIEGTLLNINQDSVSTDILISKNIADKLHLKLDESIICYFIQEPVRTRRFHIKGIYETHFTEYDQLFILADIKQLRRLNDWDSDLVSGLEILVKDYEQLDKTLEDVYFDLSVKTDRLGNPYYVRSVKQLNPGVFAWLDALDTNVVVILILMILVAGFSMISGLLIIILERANMIGILKALGQNNASIRKVFLYVSGFLILKGLFWGNVIALAIYFIQKYTGIFTLDPTIYYVSQVSMELNIGMLLLVNIGTLLATLLMLVGPSYFIANISPAKTIRFE